MEGKYFGFVYEVTNIINGKKYIGKCIFSRQNDWKKYLGSGFYLKRAVKKYGRDKFKRDILFLALDEKELNELEEAVIELSNAVESDEYYNLKKTSIGGDCFTFNPRKEEIRLMRKKQMSGKNNHQYGKKKTEKMINAVKLSNSKKVMIDHVVYDSINDYSKQTGLLDTTINYRLQSPYFPNYLYLDSNGKPIGKQLLEKVPNTRKPRPVTIQGTDYNSVSEAVKALRIGRANLIRRLKSAEYSDWRYLEICE